MVDDEHWMRLAIAEAERAASLEEVPVGAVVVRDVGPEAPAIVGRGYNRRETDRDPTAHAEILALREAAQAVGGWRLDECTLYVTQEPCPMCAGAVVNARVRRLVYGCDNPKAGSVRTLYQIVEDPRLNHRAQVVPGVLAEECGGLLTRFFQRLRARERSSS
ncbi:MAG TPA: tRNA adenosine(34) deaminase TadA [Polyangia bacterium]|jgi:tRNA(adenine34) deaminase|nr:tRNA adenosine(34) deaminase TadA [Polyangia bacterium]